jgi:hypothetical protein
VEDVVAVAVNLADGSSRYFLTWGRVQDMVNAGPVCEAVLQYASSCSLGADAEGARLCALAEDELRSASRCAKECLKVHRFAGLAERASLSALTRTAA